MPTRVVLPRGAMYHKRHTVCLRRHVLGGFHQGTIGSPTSSVDRRVIENVLHTNMVSEISGVPQGAEGNTILAWRGHPRGLREMRLGEQEVLIQKKKEQRLDLVLTGASRVVFARFIGIE